MEHHVALRKLCVDIMDGKDCLDLQVSVVRKYAQHIGYDLTYAYLSEDEFYCIMNLILIDARFTFSDMKSKERETMLKWCQNVDENLCSNLHLVVAERASPEGSTQPKHNTQRIMKLRACFCEGGAPSSDLFVLLLRYYVREIGEDQLASTTITFIFREMLLDAARSPTWNGLAPFVCDMFNSWLYSGSQWQVYTKQCESGDVLIMESLFDDSNLADVSAYKEMEAGIQSWEKEHKFDEEDENVLYSFLKQINISQWIYEYPKWPKVVITVEKSHVLLSVVSSSELKNDRRTKRKAIKLD
jgi:hypothetical protein